MKAFFAGLGTGYALGMLVAPKAGRELRQDFRATTDELRNQTEQQISRLKQTVGDAQPLFSRLKQEAQPYVDQAESFVNEAAGKLKEAAQSAASSAGKRPIIMLNTASRADLMSVYGIGPVLADKIVKGRPYTSERDVVDRNIIPEGTLKELMRSLKSA